MTPVSVVEAVAGHASQQPDKPALICGERIVSYGQLWDSVLSARARLSTLGVKPADRVCLAAAASDPTFVFGYLATHLLGAVVAPLDPLAPPERLSMLIDRIKPRATYVSQAKIGQVDGSSAIEEFEEPFPAAGAESAMPRPDALADLLFTTGTTGAPKGVLLTQANVLAAARSINAFVGTVGEDREVVPLPLSHSFGLGRLRCNLLLGATVILVSGFTFPAVITRALERWQATGFASVPAGIAVLLKAGGEGFAQAAESLRYIEIGSSPMPLEHKEQLIELLPNTRICMHYGLTEASRSVFIEFHQSRDKLDSIGKPAPGVEVDIVDDGMAPVENGTEGNLLVRGQHVMHGYFDDVAATQASFRDGWLITGDRAVRDQAGYLYLRGRRQDMINVGGRKVSPFEVEECLQQLPGIAACACVGVPDPKGITGQAVKAFLVADPGGGPPPEFGAVRAHAARALEAYKVPVEYVYIDRLPMSVSGKLLRTALIESD